MDFIGRLCDPVIVMAAGKVLAQGSASSIMQNEAVIEAYLGTGLKNKVAAEEAVERVTGESHGAQPGLGDEAGAFDGEKG
jgi:branched-chain amino acid transport system ATP-binding protein